MRPKREPATDNQQTYMVSSTTWGRRSLFQADRWAKLFLDTLYHYRGSAYLLHEFVVMPGHFHAIITPLTSLEKAVQFIKGGFSYRAKKELGSSMEVWQKGFSDHRIRDEADYQAHVQYVHQNPVKERLCASPEEYAYSSARPGFEIDPIPQRLKPRREGGCIGGPEGPPFQRVDPQRLETKSNERALGGPRSARFQSVDPQGLKPASERRGSGAPEGTPFQGLSRGGHK